MTTPEPYDAAIDFGVPANATNGAMGTRNDFPVAARILREVSRVTITLALDHAPPLPMRKAGLEAPVEAVTPTRAEVVLTSIDQGAHWGVAGLSVAATGGYNRFFRANPGAGTWADETPAWVRRLGELVRADDGDVESAPAYCSTCGYGVELRGVGVPGSGPWVHVEGAAQAHVPDVREDDDSDAARYRFDTRREG